MHRREPGLFAYGQHIVDVGMQHRGKAGRRHDVVWGGGFRYRHDTIDTPGMTLSMADHRFDETLFNGFIQDQISVTRNLKLTAGTKIEHAGATGWNLQPTIRGWWSPDGTTALWAGISRALHTPSRVETSLRFNFDAEPDARPLPILFSFIGNPEAGNEQLTAYEAGVRHTFNDRVALDVSGFYNRYRGLLNLGTLPPSVETAGPFPPHVLVSGSFGNSLDAQTTGLESVVSIAMAPQWHVVGTLEVFRVSGWESSAPGGNLDAVDGATPHFQWTLRSSYSRGAFDSDVNLIAAPALRAPATPAYLRLDARLGRRMAHGIELAIVGQNLLQSRHLEAADDRFVVTTEVPRTASLRATWRFYGR
jgi:iron complex outermembrane receptor protein